MKFLLIITGMFLFSMPSISQFRHELSIYGGGGLSTLLYNFSAVPTSPLSGTYAFLFESRSAELGYAGHAGANYFVFFSNQFGIGTGAEISLYRAEASLNKFKEIYNTSDPEGAGFQFKSRMLAYREKQEAWLLNIPLMLQFQTAGNVRFFLSAGGKVALPLLATYDIKDVQLINSGYFHDENYNYDEQQFIGFGRFKINKKETLDMNIAYLLSAETGVKFRLSDGFSLYAGIYCDYGLNTLVSSKKEHLVNYSTVRVPGNYLENNTFRVNSVLNASVGEQANHPFVDKTIPLAAGLRLRFAFGLGRTNGIDNSSTPEVHWWNEQADNTPAIMADDQPLQAQRMPESGVIPLEPAAPRQQEPSPPSIVTPQRPALQEPLPVPMPQRPVQQPPYSQPPQYSQPLPQQAAMETLKETLSDFPFNQVKVSTGDKVILHRKIIVLRENPQLRIICEGYAGYRESQQLALKRAEAVKAYLVENGIPAHRIVATSVNSTDWSRGDNGRVEFIITN
ncbi:MAG: OmpA family protein [Bacteroidales bacterium]|nr:OmpA family protein [Bacteroidales bacterium]